MTNSLEEIKNTYVHHIKRLIETCASMETQVLEETLSEELQHVLDHVDELKSPSEARSRRAAAATSASCIGLLVSELQSRKNSE